MIGYFFVADLLGFGAIIKNSSDQQRKERVDGWISLVEESAAANGVVELQLISDTVFAAAIDTRDGLRSLIGFARRLLNQGIPRSLPVRGAIVRGEFELGRLTYGQAVVEAHQLEKAQDWIGVCCGSGLPHISGLWARDAVVVYPVPFKTGEIRLRPAVGWEVPHAVTLLGHLGKGGLVPNSAEIVTWDVGTKANNTVQFGTYLALHARSGRPWDKYLGLLPMDFIERAALGEELLY